MNHDTYRLFLCGLCQTHVRICRCCDRGQRYCPGFCQQEARRESLRRANRRYQRTRRGAQLHAERQTAYVARLRKKMTDQGPPPEPTTAMLEIIASDRPDAASDTQPTGSLHHAKDLLPCDFCGHLCAPFARRDFIRRR